MARFIKDQKRRTFFRCRFGCSSYRPYSDLFRRGGPERTADDPCVQIKRYPARLSWDQYKAMRNSKFDIIEEKLSSMPRSPTSMAKQLRTSSKMRLFLHNRKALLALKRIAKSTT